MRRETEGGRREDDGRGAACYAQGQAPDAGSRGDACKCIARGAGTNVRFANTVREQFIDPASVEIWPEPSPAEREAILIALGHMLDSARRDEPKQPSAWALAGRREALLGRRGGSREGWGRASDRHAGW